MPPPNVNIPRVSLTGTNKSAPGSYLETDTPGASILDTQSEDPIHLLPWTVSSI